MQLYVKTHVVAFCCILYGVVCMKDVTQVANKNAGLLTVNAVGFENAELVLY